MKVAADTLLWPLAVFAVAVFAVTIGIIAGTAVLGERHRDRATHETYESGIPAAGPLPRRLSLEFYLVAMFFVVFDIEAVFVLAWAVALRDVGWRGYLEVLVFVLLLVAALVYLWRLGSLDWGTSARLRRRIAGPGVGSGETAGDVVGTETRYLADPLAPDEAQPGGHQRDPEVET
jgi:NADH-quinone oxidoreductase subunit A